MFTLHHNTFITKENICLFIEKYIKYQLSNMKNVVDNYCLSTINFF